ncbi:MAG: hypothetical protein ACLRMZ_22855 [Blautia marasmi]
MIYDKNGAVVECVSGFPERFAESYQLEMQEFINCVESGRKPEVTVYDGTKSTQIGFATTEAWKKAESLKSNTDPHSYCLEEDLIIRKCAVFLQHTSVIR